MIQTGVAFFGLPTGFTCFSFTRWIFRKLISGIDKRAKYPN
jgi:hypothetical protein